MSPEKKGDFFPLVLFLLLLLFAGILAITQESANDDEFIPDDLSPEEILSGGDFYAEDEYGEEDYSGAKMPPGPPRWFRSNAGGMALEEIQSRLSALRSEYALVIDYPAPDELDSFLIPFYMRTYGIEIRVLYKEGIESRRQWLFTDESGITRVNAVLSYRETEDITEISVDEPDNEEISIPGDSGITLPVGFIEIYGENALITGDYKYFEDGEEMLTTYFYNGNTLVKAETEKRIDGGDAGEYQKIYTDNYRYNRSYSLRHVERVFHESAASEPVRLLFPYKILDTVSGDSFFSGKLFPRSDFFGEQHIGEGFRMIYETDSRGRIMKQTLLDRSDSVVWVIINTWSSDRITAVRKNEGENEWLTEYRYDGEGKRIAQEDFRNGILERLVSIDGVKETEELYMNGTVILRAIWEDGRKISEERIRH